jgi:hypothetical protein
MNLHFDERGYVAGWAVKLALFLALLGIVIYDGAAIAVNMFQLDGISHEVAVEVTEAAGDDISPLLLERSAKKIAKEHGTRLVGVELSEDKEILWVTIRRDAETIVINRVDQISHWGKTSATGKSFTN